MLWQLVTFLGQTDIHTNQNYFDQYQMLMFEET
jgi:hypothetical protein